MPVIGSILGTGTPIPSVELMMWMLVDGEGGFRAGDVLLEIDSSCSYFLVLSQSLLLGVRLKRRGRLR